MTILYAYDQTDLDSFNLNYWYGALHEDDEFNDNANQDGYEDNYHLYTSLNDALSLYGFDFAYDGNPFVSVGTLEDLSQWAWNGVDAWVERWHWKGWDIPIRDFYDAGATVSTTDDFALLRQVLSTSDTFYLSMDDDEMRGFDHGDRLYGYAGNDDLRGDNGADNVYGGSGDDTVRGGQGKDFVFGGAGDDTVRGGGSKDVVRGGEGRDLIYGGSESDVFEFRSGDDKDILKDFELSSDVIDLSDLGFTGTWSEFKETYIRRYGDDDEHTRIELGDGDRITIRNVAKPDLDAGDFIF